MELCPEEVAFVHSRGWIRLLQMPRPQISVSEAGEEQDGSAWWLQKLHEKSSNRLAVPLLPPPEQAVPAELDYPATWHEKVRCAVFMDLYNRGLWLTSGTKFGACFLAYPGDPLIYHAQYTVRVENWRDALHPLTIAAAGRASHAARKHMLVCSVDPSQEHGSSTDWRQLEVKYVCVAPEAGFGRLAEDNAPEPPDTSQEHVGAS
mmetsp:Transcript_14691/g.41336  ORF Transcript_14691/g.41336 Transcript_14691/m.41336 type:complete len:205 (-) Transcript_14691:82-696(-)